MPPQVGAPDEPVAAVLMHMLGDLTGRTLLVFPRRTAHRLAALLLHATAGDDEFSDMEQSAIKEAGNILSSAYMNALSDFMGMMLIPSPPSLAVDMSSAVLTTAHLQFGTDKDFVFCVESEFLMDNIDEHLRGYFLLLPDSASLHAILKASVSRDASSRSACTGGSAGTAGVTARCPRSSPQSATATSSGRSPGGSIRRTRARTTTWGSCTTTRACTRRRSPRS